MRNMPEENVVVTEKEEEPVPEFDISLFHTNFRKDHEFAVKYFGKKIVEKEEPHRHVIGANRSICKKLYGLGSILNGFNMGFQFNDLGNHVWIKQENLKKPGTTLKICLNCGSLNIDGKFIPYTRLNNDKNN
jgi:hypothetical protein